MEIQDYLLTPIYILLFFVIASIIYLRYYKSTEVAPYFFWGLISKFIGALAACMIYIYYYGGGDTINFYEVGMRIKGIDDFFDFITVFFYTGNEPYGSVSNENVCRYLCQEHFFYSPTTYIVVKISMLLGMFCFNSFLVISLMCAIYAFWSSWKFFLMLQEIYPSLTKKLFLGVFLIPSVIFWGSGLFKDTFTLGSSYLLIVSVYYVLIKRKKVLQHLIIGGISIYLLFYIRSFFLIVLMPSILFWIIMRMKNRIHNTTVRVLLAPVFLVVGISIGISSIAFISGSNEELSQEKLMTKLVGFQSWHSSLGGSAYSLGDIEYTPIGLLSKFPEAVNVSLFRPYVFEVHNIVMLFSSLQSLFFLFYTLKTIFRTRLRFPIILFENPEVTFFLLFSLIYAFFSGITSYNFGALDRYRIPALSMFLIMLILVNHDFDKIKNKQVNS